MYWYGMRLRGFSIGCQPMEGLVDWVEAQNPNYYDYLFYDRKLTDDEVKQYDLEFFGNIPLIDN